MLNRSAFESRLDQELHRAQRYGNGFALVMFDLDRFKAVNDRFGHEVGDQVLREVAHLAREELRTSDVVGRWGGEEFLLLLPEASPPRPRPWQSACGPGWQVTTSRDRSR